MLTINLTESIDLAQFVSILENNNNLWRVIVVSACYNTLIFVLSIVFHFKIFQMHDKREVRESIVVPEREMTGS